MVQVAEHACSFRSVVSAALVWALAVPMKPAQASRSRNFFMVMVMVGWRVKGTKNVDPWNSCSAMIVPRSTS